MTSYVVSNIFGLQLLKQIKHKKNNLYIQDKNYYLFSIILYIESRNTILSKSVINK